MPYQVFEHTADIGLDVESEDLHGLFADAARGLFDVVRGDNTVAPAKRFPVNTQAGDLSRLLVRFLNEFIYLMDAEGVVFTDLEDVHVKQQDDAWRVQAVVTGEPFSHTKHPGCLHVKAATRHETRVTVPQRDRPARAHVILDV